MPENPEMHHLGFCRICGTGPLGLRACGQCGEIVVLCDECDALWTDANFGASPQLPGEGSSCCPYCESSLFDPPSHWATLSEIAKVAWLQSALRAGDAKLGRGEPLA